MPRTYKPVPPSEHKAVPKRGPKPETLELGRRCLELLDQGVDRSLLFARLHVTRKKVDHALRQTRQYEAQAAAEKPGEPAAGEKPRRAHRAVHQRPSEAGAPANWKWQDAAACKDQPLDLFFDPEGREPESVKEGRENRAKHFCGICTVRTECLDYAIGRPEKYGRWGGLDADTRTGERRKRMRAASEARARDLAEAS